MLRTQSHEALVKTVQYTGLEVLKLDRISFFIFFSSVMGQSAQEKFDFPPCHPLNCYMSHHAPQNLDITVCKAQVRISLLG